MLNKRVMICTEDSQSMSDDGDKMRYQIYMHREFITHLIYILTSCIPKM